MGTEAFEATVADVQSEREARERDMTRRAGNMYRELVGNGMSDGRANALVHSVFFTDDPGATTTHVEHTGVFGLWSMRKVGGEWRAMDTGIQHGPRCVMEAELRQLDNPHERKWLEVREFGPDGTPIIEDAAPKDGK